MKGQGHPPEEGERSSIRGLLSYSISKIWLVQDLGKYYFNSPASEIEGSGLWTSTNLNPFGYIFFLSE